MDNMKKKRKLIIGIILFSVIIISLFNIAYYKKYSDGKKKVAEINNLIKEGKYNEAYNQLNYCKKVYAQWNLSTLFDDTNSQLHYNESKKIIDNLILLCKDVNSEDSKVLIALKTYDNAANTNNQVELQANLVDISKDLRTCETAYLEDKNQLNKINFINNFKDLKELTDGFSKLTDNKINSLKTMVNDITAISPSLEDENLASELNYINANEDFTNAYNSTKSFEEKLNTLKNHN